jgi:hypothetical protein
MGAQLNIPATRPAVDCNTRTVESPSALWTTDAFTVAASSFAQVAGADPRRRSVTVTVDPDSAGDAYLTPTAATPYTRGVRLVPGAGYSMNTAAAVYVITAPAAAATVYVVTESGAIG